MSTTESVLETPQLAEGSLLDEIMQQTRMRECDVAATRAAAAHQLYWPLWKTGEYSFTCFVLL